MEYGIIKQTLDSIDKKDYSLLASRRYTEDELKSIARGINKRDPRAIANDIITQYINEFNNSDYDWNMGSILSHINFGIIISIISNIDVNKRPFLYDSIGISWVLGESNSKNKIVIDFLENVIEYSRNSTAWWNAAYSLKEIDNRNAVSILKKRILGDSLKDLDYYLSNLHDKKSLIGILIHSDTSVVKTKIYPFLIDKLTKSNYEEKLNIIWLLGRLRLFNNDAFVLVQHLIENSDDYELIYQIFKAMEENPSKEFYEHFKRYLNSNKSLLIKLSIRGIAKVGNVSDVEILRKMIIDENNENLISELTRTIYILEDSSTNKLVNLKYRYNFNEKGLINDKSNSWYKNPEIYESFSYAEDYNRIAFRIIKDRLKFDNHKVVNPVDLATGTGRTMRLIYDSLDYDGVLYGVDNSSVMLEYLAKNLEVSKSFIKQTQLIEANIVDLELPEKSSLIVSSFGFPSSSSNIKQSYQELRTVYNNLSNNGIFVTYGWDEYYSDDLAEMWYKYIPDTIKANTFEHWSSKKEKINNGARNCNLKWYKRKIKSQVKFDSLEESVRIMGMLFGRDCIDEILDQNRTSWWLSMGITYNTRDELGKILEEYENEGN